MKISVIVPTIGGQSLRDAVMSVAHQNYQPFELIIADDSEDGISDSFTANIDVAVRLVRTRGLEGAAAARNAGLHVARGSHVAFLDDDDTWMKDHLLRARDAFAGDAALDIYCCRALVNMGHVERESPRVVKNDANQSLRSFLYGRGSYLDREKRIMTPTLVFRWPLDNIFMDESLRSREDLWWLLQHDDMGRRLVQSAECHVVVNSDSGREAGRESASGLEQWIERLDSWDAASARRYLVGTRMRNALRRGDLVEFRRLGACGRALSAPLPYWKVSVLSAIASASAILTRLRHTARTVGRTS